MLSCAESILKKLEIPYQVILLSSGDMGFSAEKPMILRLGYHLKKNTERYRVAHLVALFKPGEWELNINLKAEMNI